MGPRGGQCDNGHGSDAGRAAKLPQHLDPGDSGQFQVHQDNGRDPGSSGPLSFASENQKLLAVASSRERKGFRIRDKCNECKVQVARIIFDEKGGFMR